MSYGPIPLTAYSKTRISRDTLSGRQNLSVNSSSFHVSQSARAHPVFAQVFDCRGRSRHLQTPPPMRAPIHPLYKRRGIGGQIRREIRRSSMNSGKYFVRQDALPDSDGI